MKTCNLTYEYYISVYYVILYYDILSTAVGIYVYIPTVCIVCVGMCVCG